MGRRSVTAAVVVGVALLLGPAGHAAAAEKPEGKVAVSGTVSDPATGNPVSDAPVSVTVTSTAYVPATDGEGNESCEELYPNPSVTTATNGLGDYYAEVLAYPGSEQCEFMVIGNAQLPSGEVVKAFQVVSGLFAGAKVPLNIPAKDVRTSASPEEVTDGGDRSPSPTRGILVGVAVVLGSVALLGFFLWLTVLVARAARRKGRSFWAWFWIAFFFLIPAAIIVAIMAPKPEYTVAAVPTPAPPTSPEPVKRCPFCGEEILAVATKCKHCGEFLT